MKFLNTFNIIFLIFSIYLTTVRSANCDDLDEIEINTREYNTSEVKIDCRGECGDVVKIGSTGGYYVEGSIEGKIVIETKEDGYVNLILDNVTFRNEQEPAIVVIEAEKVFITLIGENYLYSNTSVAISSKSDLIINGKGSLNIITYNNKAISCDTKLKMVYVAL